MTDREALRVGHIERPAEAGCELGQRFGHDQGWTCDTIRALDGWDAAEQDAAMLAAALDQALYSLEWLHSAYLNHRDDVHGNSCCGHRVRISGVASALAAHRERTDPGKLDADEAER